MKLPLHSLAKASMAALAFVSELRGAVLLALLPNTSV